MPFTLTTDADTYALVKMTEATLQVSEEKALTYLTEIGICNIINYPTGNKLIDDILEREKFKDLVFKIKGIWNMQKKD